MKDAASVANSKNTSPAKEKEKPRFRYQQEIQQMMHVFGQPDALGETTALIEDIVRSQITETLSQSVAKAHRRGSRYLSAEDLIFLIRHDKVKVCRLKSYLSWKDVRKNVKETSNDAGGDDIIDDTTEKQDKMRRRKIHLPWDLLDGFGEVLNEEETEYEDDDEELDTSLQRLKEADDYTKGMTHDEYMYYSECRQASFTYRRGKRFREWANMQHYLDTKPNEDTVEILGFLAYEMVRLLTTSAVEVMQEEEAKRGMSNSKGLGRLRIRKKWESSHEEGENQLFAPPPEDQEPIRAEHVREAYRRLTRRKQVLGHFKKGLRKTVATLII